MTPRDATYFDEMIKLVKEQIYLKGKDRQKFLLEHNAIKIENGEEVVICEYPKLVYYLKGDEITHDEGGSLLGLNTKLENMVNEKLGSGHHIEYYPRFYSFFYKTTSFIDNKIHELSFSCKKCDKTGFLKEENKWCNCVNNFLLT